MIDEKLALQLQNIFARRAIIQTIRAETADDVEEAVALYGKAERARKLASRWGRIARGEEKLKVEFTIEKKGHGTD